MNPARRQRNSPRQHRWRSALAGPIAFCAASGFATQRPITIDDLLRVPRVSDVQLAPDARAVAYTVSTPNVETNEAESTIWVVETARGQTRQVTRSGRDRSPRWSPDGKRLAFLSKEKDTEIAKGTSQVFVLTLDSGDVRPVTHMASDADTVRWSPDGVTLLVSSRVDPQCLNEECIKASAKAAAANRGARVYDQWPPWTAIRWKDDLRSHLFSVSADGV